MSTPKQFACCYKHEASCLSELRSTPSILRKQNKLVELKKRSVSQIDRLLFLNFFMKISVIPYSAKISRV